MHLSKRRDQFRVEALARILAYVLGHRPDEFGLAPGEDGYVPMKELLQALHEEGDWKFVRETQIREVLLGAHRGDFEIDGKRIRTRDRSWFLNPFLNPAELPALLFTPVRRKAHPVVMEKGLRGAGNRPVVLCPGKEMARRIGNRKDARPVILEIRTAEAHRHGVIFQGLGDLVLSEQIPPEMIVGPPVSADDKARQAQGPTDRRPKAPSRPEPAPGTFILEASRDPDPARRSKGKKAKGWKEASRKFRKQKRDR